MDPAIPGVQNLALESDKMNGPETSDNQHFVMPDVPPHEALLQEEFP